MRQHQCILRSRSTLGPQGTCHEASSYLRSADYHHLQGVIDIDVEINRSEKKLAFAKLGLEKLAKTMQSESYVKKPEENKAKDAEKVSLRAVLHPASN